LQALRATGGGSRRRFAAGSIGRVDAPQRLTDPDLPLSTGSRFARGITVAVIVLAMLQLLFFQLEPGAPLWQVPAGTSPQQMAAASMNRLDGQVQAAAAGGNLELHLPGFDPADDRQALMLGAIYYRANYTLYPRRAWVGRGDRTINLASDLVAADAVADDRWLRQHDVKYVQTIVRFENGSVGEMLRAVR
jgi:hypothetical protein